MVMVDALRLSTAYGWFVMQTVQLKMLCVCARPVLGIAVGNLVVDEIARIDLRVNFPIRAGRAVLRSMIDVVWGQVVWAVDAQGAGHVEKCLDSGVVEIVYPQRL